MIKFLIKKIEKSLLNDKPLKTIDITTLEYHKLKGELKEQLLTVSNAYEAGRTFYGVKLNIIDKH